MVSILQERLKSGFCGKFDLCRSAMSNEDARIVDSMMSSGVTEIEDTHSGTRMEFFVNLMTDSITFMFTPISSIKGEPASEVKAIFEPKKERKPRSKSTKNSKSSMNERFGSW